MFSVVPSGHGMYFIPFSIYTSRMFSQLVYGVHKIRKCKAERERNAISLLSTYYMPGIAKYVYFISSSK